VSGSSDMDDGTLESYAAELGLTVCKNDLTKDFYNEEDRTWLCYSTTYNPYRAIYDIGVYTAEYKSQTMPEDLVLDGVGYVACQTFTQGDRSYYGNTFWGGNYRLIRPTHAYISNEEDYGGDDEYGDTLVCNRGMFVCGPEAGKEPIKMSGFGLSKSAAIPEGCVAVHDMTDKFASKALNLALYDGERKNSLYITYPGNAPVKLKYISKITVVISHAEDISYDKTMYKLMALGGDEIIKTNLAELPSDSWRNSSCAAGFDEDSDGDDYEDSVAYIRITRTKVKNEAIGSVAMVQTDGKAGSTENLRYDETDNTASFTLAGDGISYCEGRKYYLYYSKTGNKITEFTVDKNPVNSGQITVLDKNKNLLTGNGYYFHTYSDVSLPYYSMFGIAQGDNDLAATKKLLSMGCTEVKKISLGGKPVMIGYAGTSSMLKAVKNLIFEKSTESTLTVGGAAYQSCGTVNGMTLYRTADGLKTKAVTYIAFGANTPSKAGYPDGTVFEYIQNAGGGKANIASILAAGGAYYGYISHKDQAPYYENAFFASAISNGNVVICVSFAAGILLAGAGVLYMQNKKKRKQSAAKER